jgi:hypothetical protein
VAEVQLGEEAKFFPATPPWPAGSAQADKGQAQVVYDAS